MARPPSKEYINNKAFYNALVKRKKLIDDSIENNTEKPELDPYICECIMHICKRLSYNPKFINYSYKDEMIAEAQFGCIINVDEFKPNIISILFDGEFVNNKIKGKVLTGNVSGNIAKIKSYNKLTKRLIAEADIYTDTKFLDNENAVFIGQDGEHNEFTILKVSYSNPFAYFTQCAWNSFLSKIKEEKHQSRVKASIFQSVESEFLDIQDHDSDENFDGGFTEFVKSNLYGYANMDLSTPYKQKPKKKLERFSIEDIDNE